MSGFMKGVGHASAALLIQLQTAHLAVAPTLCKPSLACLGSNAASR